MTAAKRFYTYAELTHRSTAQLIPIYNRLFNTNIWDEVFNPYEARQEILMALFAEMRAQEIVASYAPEPVTEIKPYKALEIVVSQSGMAIIWTADKKTQKSKITATQAAVARMLVEDDGETYTYAAQVVGLSRVTVLRIMRNEYAHYGY